MTHQHPIAYSFPAKISTGKHPSALHSLPLPSSNTLNVNSLSLRVDLSEHSTKVQNALAQMSELQTHLALDAIKYCCICLQQILTDFLDNII